MTRAVNEAAMALIREFEGFRADAYRDVAGVWTIGYGTTAAAGVGISPHAGMTITRKQADWYLRQTVMKFAAEVERLVKAPASDNEFGAMVSLAYNIGPGAFAGSSVLRHFNAGDKDKAAAAFMAWNKATIGGKKQAVQGLTRRRGAERALFLSPPAKPVPERLPLPSPAVGIAAALAALVAGIAAWFGSLEAWINSIFGG